MKIIGITGGIGSGKSYVSHLLSQHYGIPVYDCDTEAKRLNEESAVIRESLIGLVGPEVYTEDGHLCKPILAHYLFESEAHQHEINAIIHPVVRQDFLEWIGRQQSPIVAMESAILIESGFSQLVDTVVTVTAPLTLRIERTMQRDHTSRPQVEERIRLQLSDEERISASHYVIHNDGQALAPQIEQLIAQLTE